jgi:hypothetical protein
MGNRVAVVHWKRVKNKRVLFDIPKSKINIPDTPPKKQNKMK